MMVPIAFAIVLGLLGLAVGVLGFAIPHWLDVHDEGYLLGYQAGSDAGYKEGYRHGRYQRRRDPAENSK